MGLDSVGGGKGDEIGEEEKDKCCWWISQGRCSRLKPGPSRADCVEVFEQQEDYTGPLADWCDAQEILSGNEAKSKLARLTLRHSFPRSRVCEDSAVSMT